MLANAPPTSNASPNLPRELSLRSQPLPYLMYKTLQRNEQGMALLTVLLLVVAIVIIAGSMLASQKVMLREYALTQTQDQMREYALAGEAFAVQLVRQNAQNSQSDNLKDSLHAAANPTANIDTNAPSFNVPHNTAKIVVSVQDLAAQFNINNLYHDGKRDDVAVAFFQQLLVSQGIEPSVAMAVLDWQDPDSDTSKAGGAEADFYHSQNNGNGQPIPVTIRNQPFVNIEELAYVRGITPENLAKLRPLLCAVPYFVPMNVNVVKPELLMAIAPNKLSAPQLQSWAASRPIAVPIDDINKFWALPLFVTLATANPLTPNPTAPVDSAISTPAATLPTAVSVSDPHFTGLFAVRSAAFRDTVTVQFEGKNLYLTSLIAKTADSTASDTPNNSLSDNINKTIAILPNDPKKIPRIVAFNRQFLPYLPN